MIDRKARDKATAAFEEYLDDGITAFEFDDRLQEIETDDRTVNEIVQVAWFHYDDYTNHKVHLTKQEWDLFQRLLLILRSDAEIGSTSTGTRRWSWDHATAWSALLAFTCVAFFVGWDLQLMLVAIPFGIMSILINLYRTKIARQMSPEEIARFPFESYSQIRHLRQQVAGFQKCKWRKELEARTVRSQTEAAFIRASSYVVWIALGPIALLFQGFPSPKDYTVKLTQP